MTLPRDEGNRQFQGSAAESLDFPAKNDSIFLLAPLMQ